MVKQNLVNLDQYSDIAKEWIYPEIERLKIQWKPSKNDKNKGILVIQIPSQKEILKPFLIKKLVEERKTSEIIFGYVERKGDKNDPKKIQNIHQIMRDGLLYDQNIKNHFNYPESLIMERNQQTQEEKQINKNKEIENTINERIKAIIKANNINNQRTIILTVYIKNNVVELKSLFADVEGSIKRKLENPTVNAGQIRSNGWSLETLDREKIVEGQLVRVMNGVKTIDLYKDGTLVFAGLVDEEFLAWASKDGLKINSLALIELIYNFISFCREIINDLSEKPSMISIKFGFINMWLNGKKSYRVPGPVGTLFTSKYNSPRNKYFSESIDFDAKAFDIGKIAYKIAEGIYLWFGIPLNNRNIPYTKKLMDSSIIIDVDQIKN